MALIIDGGICMKRGILVKPEPRSEKSRVMILTMCDFPPDDDPPQEPMRNRLNYEQRPAAPRF